MAGAVTGCLAWPVAQWAARAWAGGIKKFAPRVEGQIQINRLLVLKLCTLSYSVAGRLIVLVADCRFLTMVLLSLIICCNVLAKPST